MNLSMLIKPASSGCMMRCRYCFYADEAQCRETASFGVMSPETLAVLVRRAFERARYSVTFAFQGGEPMMAGLPFYERLPPLVEQYNTRKIPVHYAIQTNGLLIDNEWAAFFARHHFLVGLSLDGPKDLHDRYRVDAGGKGTFARVLRAAGLLSRGGVEFNVLCVVTKQTARAAAKLHGFYLRNNLRYQQYIPCLDPLGEERGGHEYSLTPEDYAQFLCTSFDCWFQEVRRGEFLYNRFFENLAGILAGGRPESCAMQGHCSMQYVVEADGSVYPCDFYALDRYRCGNLLDQPLEQIERACLETGFLSEGEADPRCRDCEWFSLCRGGCRRDRDDGQRVGPNYFCEAYRTFFPHALPRLRSVIRPDAWRG